MACKKIAENKHILINWHAITCAVHLLPDWQITASHFRLLSLSLFSHALSLSCSTFHWQCTHTFHVLSSRYAFVYYSKETSFVWEKPAGSKTKDCWKSGTVGEIIHQGDETTLVALILAPFFSPDSLWPIRGQQHLNSIRIKAASLEPQRRVNEERDELEWFCQCCQNTSLDFDTKFSITIQRQYFRLNQHLFLPNRSGSEGPQSVGLCAGLMYLTS